MARDFAKLDPRFADSIRAVRVDFGFSEFDCDPDAITAALGIAPDRVRRKGESRELPSGRCIVAPFSSWGISSTLGMKNANDHCRELLQRLEACASRFDPRWGEPTFHVVYKATHLHSGNGPFFEVDVVRGIAALGASLWQDIYAIDDVEARDGETGGPT